MKFFERQFNKIHWTIRWPIVGAFFLIFGVVFVVFKLCQWLYQRRKRGIRPVQQLEPPSEVRKRCTRTIKRAVMKRDNWTCQECGHGKHDGRKVVVDHYLSVADFPEFVAATWNLRTLCGESAPGLDDGGCNGARSDEIPPTVIDWDSNPPREICATAVIVALRQKYGPQEDIEKILVRAA